MFQIRAFSPTDREYEAIAAVEKAVWPDNFDTVADFKHAAAIRIAPLTQLREAYPDWQRKIWDLDWEFAQDEPQPVTISKPPLEQYVKDTFQGPSFRPDLWFVAVDDGRFVGLSQCAPVENEPQRLRAGMTGVARSHRRRGLATALKVNNIESARSQGVATIRTGNEENNPMYQINVNLGFRYKTAQLSFEKKF